MLRLCEPTGSAGIDEVPRGVIDRLRRSSHATVEAMASDSPCVRRRVATVSRALAEGSLEDVVGVVAHA